MFVGLTATSTSPNNCVPRRAEAIDLGVWQTKAYQGGRIQVRGEGQSARVKKTLSDLRLRERQLPREVLGSRPIRELPYHNQQHSRNV